MGFLKSIELVDFGTDTIVEKYDRKGNVINRGSVLTVREGQTAVFCDKGKAADVFGPGMYKLDTASLPVITRLLSWKYGFETPFKSDIYFVNRKEFTGIRWGTSNPVPVQTEYGIVRLRGHGTYSFRVAAPSVFLTAVSGMGQRCFTKSVSDTLRALLVGSLSAALGSCGLSLGDMTSRYRELSDAVHQSAAGRCEELGIALTAFDIENLSLPPELERAADENARLGMLRGNLDVYTQLAHADALKAAAKTGPAGTIVGIGAGMKLSKELADAGQGVKKGAKKFCSECGVPLPEGAKFCPECGQKV